MGHNWRHHELQQLHSGAIDLWSTRIQDNYILLTATSAKETALKGSKDPSSSGNICIAKCIGVTIAKWNTQFFKSRMVEVVRETLEQLLALKVKFEYPHTVWSCPWCRKADHSSSSRAVPWRWSHHPCPHQIQHFVVYNVWNQQWCGLQIWWYCKRWKHLRKSTNTNWRWGQ